MNDISNRQPAPPTLLSDAELRLLQMLVYDQCGMHFDEKRTHYLQDRLQKRMRACRTVSFYNYYQLLTSHEGKREMAALLENLAVNETSFFRNKAQCDLFHKVVMEELLQRKQCGRDRSLRVWSAGCSTGQEPYTIAMLMCDALSYHCLRHPSTTPLPTPKPLVPPPWKIEVLASDISYSVLRTAQEGVYSESQMDSVDFAYRLRYFDKVGDKYAIKKALKEVVRFDFHNLKTEFLPQGNDVIFCRNVMIYFDQAEQKRLVEKFYRCLNPGGYLFIGHAETLFGISEKFRLIHHNNGTAYQRMEEQL